MLFGEIQQKIQHAKMLDFGQIFNDSIELYKKVWLQGFIMFLLMFAVSIPFVIIIYLPLILLGIAEATTSGSFNGLAPLAFIFIILAYFFFIFVLMVVSFGLKAALYRIIRQKDLNVIGKDDYFYFLRRPYLGKTISLALTTFGISLIAMLLCVFPIIYVAVPLNLLAVIYAFNPELTTSSLVKLSFDLGNKKWFITFGSILVAGILAELVGLLLCGIGLFFTAAFVFLPSYFIYKETIGFEEHGIKLIGENESF